MKKRSPRSLPAVLMFVASSFLLAVSAHSAEFSTAPPLADGVVVDMKNGVAYVMNAKRQVEALDLSSGSPMWTSDQLAKPLALADGILIAQAESLKSGRLNVVGFNALDGNLAGVDVNIALPSSVKASLIDPPGGSFRVAAKPTGGQTVALAWHAKSASSAGVHQGYLPSPYEGQAPTMDGSKAVQRDLKTEPATLLSGGATIDLRSGKASVASAKGAFAFSEMDPILPPTPAGRGLRYVSKDGRHAMVSYRQPSGGLWKAYRWVVSDAESGAIIGELTQHAPTAAFVVDNDTLLWVSQPYYQASGKASGKEQLTEPMQLQMANLSSGQVVWKHEVGMADYTGPVAP